MRTHTHKCRRLCVWCFIQTLGFPLEHLLWERAPGFAWVTAHILGV